MFQRIYFDPVTRTVLQYGAVASYMTDEGTERRMFGVSDLALSIVLDNDSDILALQDHKKIVIENNDGLYSIIDDLEKIAQEEALQAIQERVSVLRGLIKANTATFEEILEYLSLTI